MVTRLCIGFMLLLYCSHLYPQQIVREFTPGNRVLLNPERGFYLPSGTKASESNPLDAKDLILLRTQPQYVGKASYPAQVTLLYRGYELDIFTDKDLSPEFLNLVDHDMAQARQAGMKVILRFAYTNTAHQGSCGDENGICPPYGDAPPSVVLRHIEQLKPVLLKNSDVIFLLQQGFIGIWGENYYTDHFGDATNAGKGYISTEDWHKRNKVLQALLEALPESRIIHVRTPQIRQKFLQGASAAPQDAVRNIVSGTEPASGRRIGLHNDCFLASKDDYGTYFHYGDDGSKRDTANSVFREYAMAVSNIIGSGGETCDDAFSPQNDCEPLGNAQREMAAYHYTYLNAAYNNKVNNDWDSLQCMQEIMINMGYRISLEKTILPARMQRNKAEMCSFQLANRGYAAPINPRPVYFVMRHESTKETYHFPINQDVRQWQPGQISFPVSVAMPETCSKGKYTCFLWLPDEAGALRDRPAYAIQLDNPGVWDETTGMNALLQTITVR